MQNPSVPPRPTSEGRRLPAAATVGATGSPITVRPAVVVSLVGVAVVIVTGLLVRGSTAEMGIEIWLDAHHTATLDSVAWALSWAFEAPRAVVVGVVLAAVVAWRRRSGAEGLRAGLALGLAWGSSYVVKLVVARPRPDWALLHHHVMAMETDPSFPSGHACFTAALATVALLCAGHGQRVVIAVIGVVVAMGVDASRLYMGFHYPSDVIAGAVYGAAAGFLMFEGIDVVMRRAGLDRRVDRALEVRSTALPLRRR